MKNLILTFFMLSLCTSIYTQQKKDLIVAKYDTGDQFTGERVSEEDQIIKLKIITEDTTSIDRRHRVTVYDEKNALVFSAGRYLETRGKFWTFSFGTNAGNFADSVDQRISSHLEVIFAKRFSNNLNLGVGVGFEFNEAEVSDFVFNTQFTSLYGYGRYYLNNRSRRLFTFTRLGYGFAAEENTEGFANEHNGGWHSMLGLGIHFSSKRSSKFQLMLGYYLQKTDGKEFFIDNLGSQIEADFDILIRRLIFKIGWEFG